MKLFGSTQKKIIDKTIIVMRIKYLSGCSSVSTRQLRRQLISTKVWGITYFYGAVFFLFVCLHLLNVERSNLVFLKTYNTEFDDIIITFMDKNVRTIEIKENSRLTLLNKKLKRHVIL